MDNRGDVSWRAGQQHLLSDTEKYWDVTVADPIGARANALRQEMYRECLEARDTTLPLERRSNGSFFDTLNMLPDTTLIAFRAMESLAIPNKLLPHTRQERLEFSLGRMTRMKGAGDIGSALTQGWHSYKKLYTTFEPSTTNGWKAPYPRKDKIREELMADWLRVAVKLFNDPTSSFLSDPSSIKRINGICELVAGLGETRQGLLFNLFDAIPEQLHTEAFRALYPLIARNPPLSPPRIAVISGLVHGAQTSEELMNGLALGLHIPAPIANKLLQQLTINKLPRAKRNSLGNETWKETVGKELAGENRMISLALIPDISQRHDLFHTLSKAVLLEDAFSKDEKPQIAYKVSQLIEGLSEGARGAKDRGVAPEKVQKVLDMVEPLNELENATPATIRQALTTCNRSVSAAIPDISGKRAIGPR